MIMFDCCVWRTGGPTLLPFERSENGTSERSERRVEGVEQGAKRPYRCEERSDELDVGVFL